MKKLSVLLAAAVLLSGCQGVFEAPLQEGLSINVTIGSDGARGLMDDTEINLVTVAFYDGSTLLGSGNLTKVGSSFWQGNIDVSGEATGATMIVEASRPDGFVYHEFSGLKNLTMADPHVSATLTSLTVVKLEMNKDVGLGNAIFFTGSHKNLTSWGTGKQGSYNGDTERWELSLPLPTAFTWKVRKGTFGGAGDIWENNPDHDQTNLNPSFNGGF